MRRVGGMIALISGVFGILLAGLTLLVIGPPEAIEIRAVTPPPFFGLFGWGGVVFCFLTIILSARAITAKGRLAGVLLMLCALAGGILSSGYVALFMVLACAGGLLTVLAKPQRENTATNAGA